MTGRPSRIPFSLLVYLKSLTLLPVTSGIYAIRNVITNTIYIGSTKSFYARLTEHISDLSRGTHWNSRLQNSWNKYGSDAFVFEVLLFCEAKAATLIHWEQIAIDGHINTIGWDNMYNARPTANNGLGSKSSAETRAKLSAAHKGKKHHPEWVEKIACQKRGIPRSQEVKDKISKKLKGRPTKHLRTPEWNAKIGVSNKDKKYSPETLLKFKEAQKKRKEWYVTSEETRAKQSASMKGRKQSKEHIEKRLKSSSSPEAKAKRSTSISAYWASPKGIKRRQEQSEELKGNKRATGQKKIREVD